MLLDLNLPKVSGLEVLQRVRTDERTRSLAIVVLTASEDEQDEIESRQLGINGYLRKPVEFAKLAEAVRSLNLSWALEARSAV